MEIQEKLKDQISTIPSLPPLISLLIPPRRKKVSSIWSFLCKISYDLFFLKATSVNWKYLAVLTAIFGNIITLTIKGNTIYVYAQIPTICK